MKLHTTYEVRDGYLYVKAIGAFDSTTAQITFLDWVELALRFDLDRVLCDVTRVKGLDEESLSIMTRFEIDEFVGQLLPGGLKLAVLETARQYLTDGFDEQVMINRGAQVKVTTSLQEALAWLAVPLPVVPG